MSIKDILFAAADIWLLAVGFTYGAKFICIYKNYLLGIEWIIIATSATNFLVYGLLKLDEDSPSHHIAYFLDAFSRSIGATLILVVGLMAVTHRYKPSTAMDISLFVLGFALAYPLSEYAAQIGTPGKAFFLVMNVLTNIFTIYFAKRLRDIDERGHAIWVLIATAAGFFIAMAYDFFPIPDDATRSHFYTLALFTWGLQLFVVYRAYRAMATHNASRLPRRESRLPGAGVA